MNICGAIMPDNISPYLKVYITDMERGDFVVGYIGDGASASLSAEWAAPFSGMDLGSAAGQSIGNAVSGLPVVGGAIAGIAGMLKDMAGIAGIASTGVINSAMVWQGQQPPAFSMPIYFLAHSDAYREVQQPIRVLQQMASPQLKAMSPGGRVPAKVTLDIGRRIKLVNVIIQEVTYELDAPRNDDGYFIQNSVTLQITGDTSYNRDEFESMFI
ncbi:TPA: hypothetical protein ACGQ50_000862 [Enterobacter cloacae]